jgi:WD40 repeat protein
MPPVTPKAETIVRVDVPSEEKIKEFTAAVHDNFKAEYAKKSVADKVALAEKLLQLAAETKDDPAARYVLCCEARDLGAASGKWSIVADAFEQLDAGFKVDLLPQREAALQTLVLVKGLNKETAIEATEAALQGIADAVAADKLPLANGFAAAATRASANSLSVPHINLVKKADAELKIINQEADAARKARELLKTAPDDPAANLAVGRYDALRRHEWDSALAVLAKGGDGELPALARKEIAAPTDGPGQQKIADEWWALAEKEKDSAWLRTALQDRAAHWYRRAASQVTGLTLVLVHERLKAIEEAPSPFHLGSGGASAAVRTFAGHKGAVTSLHLMSDGKRLISGSLDATVRSWDLKTGKGTANQMPQPVHSLTYSPNEQYLVVGFKDTMKVIDSNNPNSTLRLPTGAAWPGTYFADERAVVSFSPTSISSSTINGGASSGPNPARGNAILWSPTYFKVLVLGEQTWIFGSSDPPPGFPRSPFPSQRNKTLLTDSTCAAFSPAQQSAAVATADKKIQLLDLQSRSVTATFDGAPAVTRCLAFLPSGDRLLSGGEDGIVRIWDVATGKEVRHFSTGSKGISALILTTDGKQIITGGTDGIIRFWAMPRDKGTKSAAVNRPVEPQSRLASPALSRLVEIRMAVLPRDGMSWLKAS